ncbi:adenosylmethionine decarboxylase [Pyrobaculum neutrophilum]|uniref:S-adenosylmethionine decarboxylase proenzyme n=1 Tax=Pyrobaculum neutrophilum (strain DSM 2338 / JCM 9278 / NBRC 100436 / V24Sta) TaxID=444157 RepID=SPEH_PYRNV|nr:adenosylmethionine decarboxylase [Pyrobaculum neutrophilum]B1YCN7.1 RecName: Full=S-adenosylmethionine decarboxylase proenzyme; Short=AdoMetDC; Short=SAMDC; Contains: RecName: Full=S-adenosylmethionine decarboxylase beta chain; Contains: RecName: Full=S-adenosylmethionine decarboxylase alpha chain; Flags: Precursor [Pyrobaculum neutrophilum V24Sta]ACB39550.1 S-adenosylmethionine decarboxylase proenzyme [Pyrobaculum neutrophilum V24Sta]
MAGGVGAQIVGRHIYGNLYGCEQQILKDEAALITIVKEAAKVANAILLSIGSYRFGPEGGLTVFAVVAESHISIHTWPEHGFATVDVYTCGDHTDPKAAFDYIVSKLKPRKVEAFFGDRSMYRE